MDLATAPMFPANSGFTRMTAMFLREARDMVPRKADSTAKWLY
jgi:hypothetical protein